MNDRSKAWLLVAALLLPACDLLQKKGDGSSKTATSRESDDDEKSAKPKKSKREDAPGPTATASASTAPSASAPPPAAANAASTCVKACDDLIAKMTACLPDGATQADEWRKNLSRMKAIDAEGLGDMCLNRLKELPALKTCDATEKAPPSACAHVKFLCRQVMKYDAMVKALGADASAPHFKQWPDCDNPGGGDEAVCQTQFEGMKRVIGGLKPSDQHGVLGGCP